MPRPFRPRPCPPSPAAALRAAAGGLQGRRGRGGGGGHLFKIEMMLLCNLISPGAAAVTDDDLSDRKEANCRRQRCLPLFLPGRVIRWRCRIMHSPSFLPSSRRLRFQQSVDKTSKLGSDIGLRALGPSSEHQNLSTGAVSNITGTNRLEDSPN